MRTQGHRDVLQNRFVNMLAFDNDSGHVEENFEEMINERRYEPLTDSEISELFEKGASKEFVMIAQYDDGEWNTVREKANQILESDTEIDPDDDSFSALLWCEEFGEAVMCADTTNTRILREVLGLGYINAVSKFDFYLSDSDIVAK